MNFKVQPVETTSTKERHKQHWWTICKKNPKRFGPKGQGTSLPCHHHALPHQWGVACSVGDGVSVGVVDFGPHLVDEGVASMGDKLNQRRSQAWTTVCSNTTSRLFQRQRTNQLRMLILVSSPRTEAGMCLEFQVNPFQQNTSRLRAKGTTLLCGIPPQQTGVLFPILLLPESTKRQRKQHARLMF